LFPFAVKFDPQMKKWAEHSRTPPVTSRSFAIGQVRRLDGLADVEPIF
jgi:hypothetical protein